MKNIKAKFTKIVQSIDIGDGIVVMEDYFKYPERIPNIYKLDYSLEQLWEAELPSQNDAFANKMVAEDGVIKIVSWKGIYCELDQKTGKILKKTWTK